MRCAHLLVCLCIFWDLAAVAQANWFVFDLGEKKSEVCAFLELRPEYDVVSSKKCPNLDDNPTLDVTETITTETFKVNSKHDVVSAIGSGSKKLKDLRSPEPAGSQKTHTIRLVFKHDRLIALWMTFPSDYYHGIYERARKTFQNPRFEQGFGLDPLWEDKAPHEIAEKPTNWIVVFVKGITRVYLVRYNKVQDGIMTGWVGMESRTEDEPR